MVGPFFTKRGGLVRRAWPGRAEGKRPLSRPWLQWGDQVFQDLRRVGGDK